MTSLEIILKLYKEDKISSEEAIQLINDTKSWDIQTYPVYYPDFKPIEPYYKVTCTNDTK